MSILCTIDRNDVPLDKQEQFLDTLIVRLQAEFPGEVIEAAYGNETSFVNSSAENEYLTASLPKVGPGIMQDIILF